MVDIINLYYFDKKKKKMLKIKYVSITDYNIQ